MGSAASKTAKAVPKGAPRKYPTRAAGESAAQASRPAAQASRPAAAATKAKPPPPPSHPRGQQQEPETDGPNADFASRLRQMGIVQPNPTFSPSSTAGRGSNDVGGPDADMLRQIEQHKQKYSRPPSAHGGGARAPPPRNTTLSVLDARRRIQDEAAADHEQSMSTAGRAKGREFLKAAVLRDILVLRARGVGAAAIEARLRLKPGVVQRLGPAGLYEALNVAAPEAAAAAAAAETAATKK